MNNLRIAVDFDDVIHDPKKVLKGYKMGVPVEGALEALKQLHMEGNIVIIHSVWADTDKKREAMSAWCRYFGVPYDFITNIKPVADLYLDNKAYRFRTWPDAMEFIRRLSQEN